MSLRNDHHLQTLCWRPECANGLQPASQPSAVSLQRLHTNNKDKLQLIDILLPIWAPQIRSSASRAPPEREAQVEQKSSFSASELVGLLSG